MTGRARRRVGLLLVIATSLATSGCGVDDASTAGSRTSAPTGAVAVATTSGTTAAPSTETPLTTAPTSLGNESAWCDAIAQLIASQPAGSYSSDEHEVAFLAYAEAAEDAALAAPDDAEVLAKLAEAARVSAADPGDPRQAELYGDIADELFEINLRASRECGISIDGLPSD